MRVPAVAWLVLVAGGLGLTLWLTRERAAQAEVPTESLLEGRRLQDARRIVLRRASDAPPIHLAHAEPGAPFTMVEPIEDLASPAFVDNLRATLESAQRLLVAPAAELPPETLAEMGLHAPRAAIEVRYPDRTLAIDIGLEGPLLADLFIRCDGKVYRTGLAVWSVIQANVSDVRDRAVVQTPPDDIRKVVLRRRPAGGREETVAIERTGLREFRMLQPLATRASPEAAAAFFTFLSGMRVDQFLDALNPMPEWNVQVEIDGALGRESVTIWELPGGIVGRQEPRGLDFAINTVDYTRTFQVPVDELRARLLVPVPVGDIARIEVDPGEGGGERIQLRRGFGDSVRLWRPIEGDADQVAVNELLQATQTLHVAEFLDVPAAERERYGLARGFLTVSIHPHTRENEPVVLHVGRTEGEHTYVRRADEEFVAKVARAQVDLLRRPWPTYASRAVAGPASQLAVGAVVFAVDGQPRASYSRDAEGRWRRAGRDGDFTDQIVDLLEVARSARARRALDARDPAVQAELASALRIELRLEREPGDVIHTLEVYDRGAGPPALVRQPAAERLLLELGGSDSRALLDPGRE